MKAWTSAETDGRCAYDVRPWKTGARVFRIQGATWRKDYCIDCSRRHGAPPDTGEVLGLEHDVQCPAPLRELAAQLGAELVPVADEPLFEQAFEE